MKIFDLRCQNDHRFEGWFASHDAYETQRGASLIACPVCSGTTIDRLPSAPYLNLSSAAVPPTSKPEQVKRAAATRSDAARTAVSPQTPVVPPLPSGLGSEAHALAQHLQSQWMKLAREVVRQSENVGDDFAEEARRIHYNEAPERAIRGVASADQVAELADEGIDVMSLSLPDAFKETLQ